MEELALKDYFLIIKKKKWFVISLIIIFSIVASLITYFNMEPVYKTYTSLIIEETKGYYDSDNNQKYLDQKFMNTYSEIVKSKLVMNDVKKNLELDFSLKDLSENIEVSIMPDTDIIKIEVIGKNPKTIANIANETAKVSIQHMRGMNDIKGIKVIDEAQIPQLQTNSVSKSNIINIFIAGLLGALVSISIVFLLEHLDGAIKNPKHVEKHLEIPVIGIIQKTKKSLVMYEEPDSFTAENYRTLITNIMSIQSNKGIKSILITSSIPNEDRSLVVSNIAIGMSRTERKVLLIDGDLRKPSIHTYFDMDNNLGLSNILKGNKNCNEVIKKTEKNFHILTSGQTISNPAELLASNNMKDLLEKASKKYDTIIINSPSLGGVTDATTLSAITDGTILVCSVGETDIDEIKIGKKLLEKVNTNILGMVLNKVIIEKDNYYKYYYSSYMYYKENRKEEQKSI